MAWWGREGAQCWYCGHEGVVAKIDAKGIVIDTGAPVVIDGAQSHLWWVPMASIPTLTEQKKFVKRAA